MSLTPRQVIERALRMMGAIASGDTPTASEANDAFTAYNTMVRALYGTLIGPRLTPFALTGATGQAENGGSYQIPGGAAFTLTAPANPVSGSRFGVVDAALSWTSHPLTITAPGSLINGSASNYVISTAGQNTRFWYRGDLGDWVIEADAATLDSAISFPDHLIAYLPYMLAVVLTAEYGPDVRPDTAAAAQEGREAFARTYARRGRASLDPPIGLTLPGPAAR